VSHGDFSFADLESENTSNEQQRDHWNEERLQQYPVELAEVHAVRPLG